MAIYQRQEPGDATPEKIVGRGDQCRHLVRLLPESGTALLEYPAGSQKVCWSNLPSIPSIVLPVWSGYSSTKSSPMPLT